MILSGSTVCHPAVGKVAMIHIAPGAIAQWQSGDLACRGSQAQGPGMVRKVCNLKPWRTADS